MPWPGVECEIAVIEVFYGHFFEYFLFLFGKEYSYLEIPFFVIMKAKVDKSVDNKVTCVAKKSVLPFVYCLDCHLAVWSFSMMRM